MNTKIVNDCVEPIKRGNTREVCYACQMAQYGEIIFQPSVLRSRIGLT